jgi:hypothetical protein
MTHTPDDKTRAQVKVMAAYGLDRPSICAILAITDEDLVTHYATEYVVGPLEAEAKVRQALYTKAIGGDVNAMRAWLEQNGGGY